MSFSRSIEKEISLKSVFDNVAIGIMALDREGTIRRVNKTCLRIFDCQEENLLSQSLSRFLDDQSVEHFSDFLKREIGETENAEDLLKLELVINSFSGKAVPIELVFSSRFDDSGDLFITTLQDISRRKALEKKLIQQRENQEEIEVELHKEQELNELKSRFVSMASHEFRTPLAGVLSSVDLVQRYVDDEKQNGNDLQHHAKISAHVEKIRAAVRNLTLILNEYLSVSKLEEGKVSSNWEEVNLDDLVRQTISELNHMCKSGQEIQVHENTIKGSYILDKNLVRNIIYNLVSNAIKYSPENKVVKVSLWTENEHLFLRVEDEGMGIPEEEQENLFNRFFRAQNARHIQGTGLGLHIVKKYVEMMDGGIEFQSALNEGSSFTVILPLKHEI